jgi:hypothetical protein
MAIDKALYQAPEGIEAAAQEEQPLEIEIVDPEAVKITAGPVEIEIEPGKPTPEDFNANLAEFMDERDLEGLASDLSDDIQNDLNSRKDWEKMLKDGIQLLGLKYEDRTEPWPGACGVFHPMITEAVVRFQSDTIMETFPAAGPVKTKIVGKQTREKDEAARRVADDLNWQLTENMVEFRPEHERMLWNLPGAGSAFKKVYRDPALQRQTSVFVPAEDVILPYGASDLVTCHRVTHRMRYNKQLIDRMQYDGLWRDVDVGDPPRVSDELQKRKDEETGFSSLNDTRYIIYEAAVDLDLKGFEDRDKDGELTGVALPYIVTMVYGTNLILAVRRNWREEDKTRQKRLHYVHYQYIPGYGAYGFGLFHLIGGFAKSATSIMRQLVDAGTLSNLPGGLKSRGLRIKGDDTPIAPGEFRDVDVGSGAIRDNILPLPYKEPSMVLSGLLDKIVDEGRRFAATSDMKIADMSNQAPVGSTLAILERSLKVMSAVQARVHFSFKQELKLIAELVREDVPDGEEYPYDVDAPNGRRAKYSDYRHVEIIPVSDPNAATISQRVVQYQAVLQLAQTAPQIYDMPELHRQMLHVIGIKNIDKLVPTAEDMKPKDPVQENQDVLAGKPLKAFAYQDHEAHITVHRMAAQDPLIQQLVGQNPQAQTIMAALQAHIAEHVGFAYRNRISTALGAPLPDSTEGLDSEMEYQISQLLAQAAPQVLTQSQVMVAQQQAQQNAQDPVLQIQMQELQIKAKEVEIKEKAMMADAAAKADEIRLKEQELAAKTGGAMQDMQANAMRMQQERGAEANRLLQEHQGEAARMMRESMKHDAEMQRQSEKHNFERVKARQMHEDAVAMKREQHAEQMRQAMEAQKVKPKKEPTK